MKKALCIKVKDQGLNIKDYKPFLLSRSICEENTDFLQIIPYVTLINREDGCVFRYTRGSGGQENRLHSKTSIGIGGHMECEPTSDIISMITEEAVREIEEEVGFKASFPEIEMKLSRGMYHTLYTNTGNLVDKVHLGISFSVFCNKAEMTKLEEGVIIEPTWLTIDDLKTDCHSPFTRLETWSIMTAKRLTSKI